MTAAQLNKQIREASTQNEARQAAIDWQAWQSDQTMSYFDMAMWAVDFKELAEKFNLTDEFKEGGIL